MKTDPQQKETTKEVAKRMFLDTRYYGKYRMDRDNGTEYGKDLKQLLMAHMRSFVPNAPCGEQREKERDKERNRLINAITKPWSRWQFSRAIDELLTHADYSYSLGIVTRGNPAYAHMKELPKGELDEVELFNRAYTYCRQMQYAAQKYPWLFYKTLVLGIGYREWRYICVEKDKGKVWVKFRPLGYYQYR